MIVVVGGAYDEACADPALVWTFGSGLRAAAILGERVERLVTAADDATLDRARAVLGDTRIVTLRRQAPLRFVYDTPLSPPHCYQAADDRDLVLPAVNCTNAVVFGMVEASVQVTATRAVIDPQHSLLLDQIATLVVVDDLVVVANCREVRHLAKEQDLARAAQVILERTGATAVVIKAGAVGAIVVTGTNSVGIPPFPTDMVLPIGSGDVFTAEFAAAYFDGANSVEAAIRASERTAGYCATRQTGPVNLTPLFDLDPPSLDTLREPPCVYLAASFFTPEQRWSARTAAHGIDDVGGRSFYPLRDLGPVEDQVSTARSDLNALGACGSVLLLADAARSGPFFEAGWATRAGIPVVVATSDPDPTRFTMLRGCGATVVHDLSTAVYQSIWQALRHRRQSAE